MDHDSIYKLKYLLTLCRSHQYILHRPHGHNDNSLPEKKQEVGHRQFTYLQETAGSVRHYYAEESVSHTLKLYGEETFLKI